MRGNDGRHPPCQPTYQSTIRQLRLLIFFHTDAVNARLQSVERPIKKCGGCEAYPSDDAARYFHTPVHA